jgi:hypothetical protein
MDLEYQSLHKLWKILNSYIGNLKDKINQEIRVNILVWCVSTYMIYMVLYIYSHYIHSNKRQRLTTHRQYQITVMKWNTQDKLQ